MKVLLTGNLFHDYELDIRKGLEQLGHEVDLRFNNIHGPYQIQDPKTILPWLKYGVLPHKMKIDFFTKKSIDNYNKDLQQLIQKNSYDRMIVVGAKTIYPETIAAFKGRKIFWFMDALHRYQFVMPKISLFDDLFVFEPTDITYIKDNLGLEAKFLTLAFDDKRYYKKNQNIQYDFSFVGSFYPKREAYLHSLLSVSNNMAIYGDFYRSSFKELKAKMIKANVPAKLANDLYNSSKININIHHPQSVEGMAIRTFEILGAGGFQIMERQKGALPYFQEDTHIAYYESNEEFLEKCKYYLQHDEERIKIAAAAHKIAVEKHTWRARFLEMEQML